MISLEHTVYIAWARVQHSAQARTMHTCKAGRSWQAVLQHRAHCRQPAACRAPADVV